MRLKKIKKRFMTLLELLIGMALTMLLLSTLTYFYQEIQQLNSAAERTQKEIFQLQYAESRLNGIIPKILSEKKNSSPFFFLSNNLNGLLADNNPSLVFHFETGTDLDSSRAVSSLGRLYLDRQNRLCLATWSDPEDWTSQNPPSAHIEVLMENVRSLQFLFFVAPDRDRSLIAKTKKASEPAVENNAPDKTGQPAADTDKKPKVAKLPKNNQSKAPLQQEPPQVIDPTPIEDPNRSEPEPKGEWISHWKREFNEIPPMIKIIITQSVDGEDKKSTFAFPLLNSKNVIVYE